MKKATKSKVNKALTPEEKAILGNIRSLLEQLDSEEVSEDMDTPATDEADEVMASADEEEVGVDEEEEEDEETVEKEACEDEQDKKMVKKASTPDEVANNDAEERLNAEDTDVDNALAVLKSVLSKKKPVRKSASLVRLERKVDDLTTCVEGMLEGFGVVPAPVQKSTRMYDRVRSMVNKSVQSQREGDLSDVMTALFGNK